MTSTSGWALSRQHSVRRAFFTSRVMPSAIKWELQPNRALLSLVAGTCGNFPGWIGVDIKGTLEREFCLPVTVANDANCMLLGEVWAGAAKGYTDVIGVTLGTGVGGGILIGGGVSAQQELLIDPLAEKVRASVMPAFAEGLELKSAALQNDAGLVGAVYYFKKHHD